MSWEFEIGESAECLIARDWERVCTWVGNFAFYLWGDEDRW